MSSDNQLRRFSLAVGIAIAKLRDLPWQLRWRFVPQHRYNVIYTDLPVGYHDPDTRILWGAMQCLVDHIEEGMGGAEAVERFNTELRRPSPYPEVEDGLAEVQADTQDKALALYRWWKIERPANWQRYEEMLDRLFGNGKPLPGETNEGLWDYEEQLHQADEEALVRLASLRRCLWT